MAGLFGMKWGVRKIERSIPVSKSITIEDEELLYDLADQIEYDVKTRNTMEETYMPKTYEQIRAEQEAAGTRSDRDRALDILWDLMQKEKSEGVTEDELTLAKNIATVVKMDMNL